MATVRAAPMLQARADTRRGGLSSDTVIDLTSSDTGESSDTLISRPLTQTRIPFRHDANIDIDITSDGLLPEGSFGRQSHTNQKRTTFLHYRASNGTASRPKLALKYDYFPRPKLASKPRYEAKPKLLPMRASKPANPLKRRRVEPGATRETPVDLDKINCYTPEIAVPDRTVPKNSEYPSPVLTLTESIHARVNLYGGDKREKKKKINENLLRTLREQVFPHINQCLIFHRRSIDRVTRRQHGKKVAARICGDEFLDNLDQNNGRLSPAFESKIAAKARSIVDQLMKEMSTSLDVEQGSTTDTREETPPTETVVLDRPAQKESQTASDDQARELNRAGKLSILMKARWASGNMDAVTASRVAKNARKRALNQIPEKSLESKRRQKGPAPTTTSRGTKNLDSATSSDSCARRARPTRFVPKSHLKSTRSLHEAMTLGGLFPEPSSRGSPQSKRRAQRTPSSLQHRIGQPPYVNPAMSKIEDLRLVGLDKRVSRPYLSWSDRQDIQQGLAIMVSKEAARDGLFEPNLLSLQGSLLHVDFFKEEIEELIAIIDSITGRKTKAQYSDSYARIQSLMSGREGLISMISSRLASDRNSADRLQCSVLLRSRTNASIIAFLKDAMSGSVPNLAAVSRINLDRRQSQHPNKTSDTLSSILQQRETWGRHRYPHNYISFKARMVNLMEDRFVREAEWTDCAGDIATISWLDCNRFFCGATAHSDEHNMQYNKPGNLLTGSVVARTLKSVAGHQIVRPIVTKGENSRASMRETQDPWMYCSVTSTAYSYDNRKCFSGSYDQTVKVWDIAEDGSSMELCGVWEHAGNVNFVAASPHHGLVATAADVREDAVRVYHFIPEDISNSTYQTYEASVQRRNSHDTWAYFPATMQWGISPGVAHMLLVGYSPRSLNGNDLDIPEDKSNTGELCLWNVKDRSRIVITSARTQNVFEVLWHPSQPIFVAATSPAGDFEDETNTQLRIFGQTEIGTFLVLKTLDCPARDINEITLKPNSNVDCYVTASCTNSRTYVWDSAFSEKPIHTLRHGDSIDEQSAGNSMEETDSGVKFAAWGKTNDRFYTGSSDGVVKAWNIRAPRGQAFVRDIICLSGGVSAGKFSPDFSNLILGDATGKVHLLSFSGFTQGSDNETLRRPITPHQPLPPPLRDEDDQEIDPPKTAQEIARQYLDQEQIIICEDEYIGAVQGPRYADTGLHYDFDKFGNENDEHSTGWSKAELLAKQQDRLNPGCVNLARLPEMESSSRLNHERNLSLDLNTATLSGEGIKEFEGAGIDLRFNDEHEFAFERGTRIKREMNNNNILKSNELLDPDEVEELQKLQVIVSEELELQKALETLLF